ncbi:MAG: hypothetical protein AB8B57_02755 [Congregibacter sp.]
MTSWSSIHARACPASAASALGITQADPPQRPDNSIAVQDLSMLGEHEVTVSIGVSEVEAGFEWNAWIKSSDEELHRAKARGRNQAQS